jgi:hypothetical protein
MKKLLFSLAVLALPVVANADPGNGIDMQWQDCVGGTEVHDRVLNCTGNSTHNLILNVKLNRDLPTFVAYTAYIDIQNETSVPVSPFWHYETGGCNRGAVSGALMSTGLPAPTNCADNFTDLVNGDPGSAVSGFVYGPDYTAPGRGKFILSTANPGPVPLSAGVNYFVLQLQLNTRNRPNSVAPASQCAGCTDKVALVFNTLNMESQLEGPIDVTGADKGQVCATVNGAQGGTCGATPARPRTWGSVKALYR